MKTNIKIENPNFKVLISKSVSLSTWTWLCAQRREDAVSMYEERVCKGECREEVRFVESLRGEVSWEIFVVSWNFLYGLGGSFYRSPNFHQHWYNNSILVKVFKYLFEKRKWKYIFFHLLIILINLLIFQYILYFQNLILGAEIIIKLKFGPRVRLINIIK